MTTEEKLDKAVDALEKSAVAMEGLTKASTELTQAALSMMNAIAASQEGSIKAMVHAIKSSAKNRMTTEELMKELTVGIAEGDHD